MSPRDSDAGVGPAKTTVDAARRTPQSPARDRPNRVVFIICPPSLFVPGASSDDRPVRAGEGYVLINLLFPASSEIDVHAGHLNEHRSPVTVVSGVRDRL